MSKKPIIGITTGLKPFTDGPFFGSSHIGMQQNYVDCVLAFGGVPVLLPVNEDKEVIHQMVDTLDGVIISGGDDVNPMFYGEDPHPMLGKTVPARDIFDMEVIRYAYETNKPVLGICRGIQIMNVAFGGTLWQDLNQTGKPELIAHSNDNEPLSNPRHYIHIEKDTFLYDIYGSKAMVNSCHHEAVKHIADGFKVAATSSDGIIEAMYKTDCDNIIAVQFHPEWMALNDEKTAQLFVRFIDMAKA